VSNDWVKDIRDMHTHYGFHGAVEGLDAEKLRLYLSFRAAFLREELRELEESALDADADGVVDALIDLCVVAIGTLDIFGVDSELAWDRVLRANMEKRVGVKPSRPNPLGLPDLVKPAGWVAPTHADNLGLLGTALRDD
jgi:predicted HAD superfamily Cof-like phosphohydrolase